MFIDFNLFFLRNIHHGWPMPYGSKAVERVYGEVDHLDEKSPSQSMHLSNTTKREQSSNLAYMTEYL